MQSAFGGEYPGVGAQLGQATTFGWVARHAAAERDQTEEPGRTALVDGRSGSESSVARGPTP